MVPIRASDVTQNLFHFSPHGQVLTRVICRFCLTPSGEDVEISLEGAEETSEEDPVQENCHFHAGVEYVPRL
jgi:hypothetical protein